MSQLLPHPSAFPSMSQNEFIEAIHSLFEPALPLAEHLYRKRNQFSTYQQLVDEAERVTLHEFPLDIQLQIINAHPRLGAQKQTLSLQSYKEQGYNKQQADSEESNRVNEELMKLNDDYEHKFGFKFVLFVNGRPRKEIIPIIRQHIETGDKSSELRRGLLDMMSIARDRLKKAQLAQI